jgi:hypothetical protein
MNRYLSLLVSLVIFTCFKANAQAVLQGRVYELNTHVKLQSIRVTNISTQQFTVSDTSGTFLIYARPGDILAFRGYSYKPDTVAIVNKNHLEIYLEPISNVLNEVKVNNTDVKTGSLKDPSLKGQTVVYQRDENGNYKGGVAIRFGYGKDKKAMHSKQLSDEEATEEEIDLAFSPQTISKTIPLKGDDLKNFILMYRPEIKVFKAPGFSMPIYLNDCYKKYAALPPDKRKAETLLKDTTAH